MNEEEKRKRLAVRLRSARETAGLSQEAAAERLGLKRPAVSEIEAGRRNVRAEELALLADLYHISMEWLMSDDATPPTKLEIAARGLSKLKSEDLDKILDLLQSLRDPGQKQ